MEFCFIVTPGDFKSSFPNMLTVRASLTSQDAKTRNVYYYMGVPYVARLDVV